MFKFSSNSLLSEEKKRSQGSLGMQTFRKCIRTAEMLHWIDNL